MEGIFIIIAIAIAIMNLTQKQNQNKKKAQSGMKRRPNTMRQSPMQQWLESMQPSDRTVTDKGNRWEEGLGGTGGYQLGSMLSGSDEGSEIEDRNRRGSLDHMEPMLSSEGICDEHPEHAQVKKNVKNAASKVVIAESKEENIFDLTEESLLRSIVMAEVLGPPRAMKRKIR